MWAFAFGCVALARGWTGPLLLFKPTLAPFALFGIWRRTWWIMLCAVGLAALPFGAMWIDYLAVARNAQPVYALFFLHDYPLLAIPLVAWAAR